MSIRQRALVKTFLTVLGISAIGIAGGFVSTLMPPAVFHAVLAAIAFGFVFWLIYSWNVVSLEMDSQIDHERKDR